MKPLRQLNNVERAKLLHQLFPNDIPDFLEYLTTGTQAIIDQGPELRKEPSNNPIITMGSWVNMGTEVNKHIHAYGSKLNKSAGLFADQLFDGYLALTSAHFLQEYAETGKGTIQFNHAIRAIYGGTV